MEQCSAGLKMDSIYQYQRHIYNFTRKYYLLGRDEMLQNLHVSKGKSVLEIGCGTGRNLIKTKQLYPEAQVFGFDISEEMLETARKSIAKKNLDIQVSSGDATLFNPVNLFKHENFDRIFISYTLSMIPRWQDAITGIIDMLGKDGELHIVDFGMQEKMPQWFKLLLFSWLKRFSVYPLPKFGAEIQNISDIYGLKLETRSLYKGYAVYAVLKRC